MLTNVLARNSRLAIVDVDKCKPNKCRLECKKKCPRNRSGMICIDVSANSKVASISETLCIGCGICVKACPFQAITIINDLPPEIQSTPTHRYGVNSFELFRLPHPRRGHVLGLVGSNGTGKSTSLRVLGGKVKPNFGKLENPPSWNEIITHHRGSSLQNYFREIVEDKITVTIKPQYVELIQQKVNGVVGDLLLQTGALSETRAEIIKSLDLEHILTRNIDCLSGGELQRFAIAITCLKNANVLMFDEPSSFLDIKQRVKIAKTIRGLPESLSSNPYVIVVEHDLCILELMSKQVQIFYGVPGAYGVTTAPFRVRQGINNFLEGFIPTENLRFRKEALSFRNVQLEGTVETTKTMMLKYPQMCKTLGNFRVQINEGSLNSSEIICLLGENGTGKTTFIRMLAGRLMPDDSEAKLPKLAVSVKPQYIHIPNGERTVAQVLQANIGASYTNTHFISEVIKPLQIDTMFGRQVEKLSGGELQRVGLCLCLGKEADIYLIDEPSAYLDSEQRLIASKVIKRFIVHQRKACFVVEHDLMMALYLADKLVVFGGEPSINCSASSPLALEYGLNLFLETIDITIRIDSTNLRPKINRPGSTRDHEQKLTGNYYLLQSVTNRS